MTPVKTLFYNKTMRTIQAIIFVICLTASSTLCGQVPDKFAQAAGELITGKTAARGAAAVPDEAARLQAQVQRSYKQALRVQQKYADVSVCAGPSKSFVSSQEQARDLYRYRRVPADCQLPRGRHRGPVAVSHTVCGRCSLHFCRQQVPSDGRDVRVA